MGSSESAQHTDQGIAAAAAGEYASAVHHLQAALRADPLNYDAYFELGRVFLRQGTPIRALQIFSRLERKLPRDPEIRLYLAEALLATEDSRGAQQALDAALRLAPHREEIAVKCSRIHALNGDTAAAQRILRRFLRRYPDAVEARCELGWQWLSVRRLERARRAFEDCLARKPDHRRAKEGISHIVRQSPGCSETAPSPAATGASPKRVPEAAAGGIPTVGQVLVDATRALNTGLPHEAVRLLVPLVQTHPTAEARALLGIAYRDTREYHEAIRVFQGLIDEGLDTNLARLQLGVTYNALRQYDCAQEVLEEALREDPDFAEAHFEMGIALHGLGRREEAVQAYISAIVAGADDPRAYVNLATVFLELGLVDRAGKAAADCLSRHPDCARAHAVLAHICVLRRQWETVEIAARAALRWEPASLAGRKYLAIALCELGREAEARGLLVDLAERIPDDPLLAPYLHAQRILP